MKIKKEIFASIIFCCLVPFFLSCNSDEEVTFVSTTLENNEKIVKSTLGYTPPQLFFPGAIKNNQGGYDLKTSAYCYVKGTDFIINSTEATEGDMIRLDAVMYFEKMNILILFPYSLDGLNTYAAFGLKYNFGGGELDNTLIKIPEDLPYLDKINSVYVNGKRMKGGIIRNVDCNDYIVQIRAKSPYASERYHKPVDIIVSSAPYPSIPYQ